MAKLTCPVCDTVLVGLPSGFYCPRCDERYEDEDVMPSVDRGLHQRDKRRAQNVAWRKVTVSEVRQERLIEDGENS